jgi:hypothetical protein
VTTAIKKIQAALETRQLSSTDSLPVDSTAVRGFHWDSNFKKNENNQNISWIHFEDKSKFIIF